MNKEQAMEVAAQGMAAFVSKLGALNALTVKHGAAIMPRSIWSEGVVSALIATGCITSEEQAQKALVVLNSDLGNSSQLGAMLLKKGTLKQEQAVQAASRFEQELAAAKARMEAKA